MQSPVLVQTRVSTMLRTGKVTTWINNRCDVLARWVILVTASLASSLIATNAFSQTNLASPLGMNLLYVSYSTPEQPFLNIFKIAGGWTTRSGDGSGYFGTTGEESLLYSSFL